MNYLVMPDSISSLRKNAKIGRSITSNYYLILLAQSVSCMFLSTLEEDPHIDWLILKGILRVKWIELMGVIIQASYSEPPLKLNQTRNKNFGSCIPLLTLLPLSRLSRLQQVLKRILTNILLLLSPCNFSNTLSLRMSLINLVVLNAIYR